MDYEYFNQLKEFLYKHKHTFKYKTYLLCYCVKRTFCNEKQVNYKSMNLGFLNFMTDVYDNRC